MAHKYDRYPSVADDHKFAQQQPGYSFSETVGSRQEPTFVTMTTYKTNEPYGMQGKINAFAYQRPPWTRCRDWLSTSIATIVHSVLFLACYGTMMGLGGRYGIEFFLQGSFGAGIWGSCVGIICGIVSLIGHRKGTLPFTTLLNSVWGFVAVAALQLVGAIICACASVLITLSIWPAYVLFPLLQLENGTYWSAAEDYGMFLLGVFTWIFSWGPVGCLIYTFRHSMTAAIDVMSL